ncbi:hypothetical protein [Crateriforma spongiae]|uniref:hypothetical protein n=1 Tax=Crateriforma spongiae TaxID=2724528 RepID=UPI0014482CF5|nr:hypothetical protein [Crateriforma spongiae]
MQAGLFGIGLDTYWSQFDNLLENLTGYRFSIGVKAFINQWFMGGPAHHCAIGVGHIAGKIRKLAKLLRTEVHQVC